MILPTAPGSLLEMNSENIDTSLGGVTTSKEAQIKSPLCDMERLARPILDALPPLKFILGGGKHGNDIIAIQTGMEQAIEISRQVKDLLEPLAGLKSQRETIRARCSELEEEMTEKESLQEKLNQELNALRTDTEACNREREQIRGDVQKEKGELQRLRNDMNESRRDNKAAKDRLKELQTKEIEIRYAEEQLKRRQTAVSNTEKRNPQESAEVLRRTEEMGSKEQEIRSRADKMLEQDRLNTDHAVELEKRETKVRNDTEAYDRESKILYQKRKVLEEDQATLQSAVLDLSGQRSEMEYEALRNRNDRTHLVRTVFYLRSAVGIVGISTVPEGIEELSAHATALCDVLTTDLRNLTKGVNSTNKHNLQLQKDLDQVLQSSKHERERLKMEIENLESKKDELEMSLQTSTKQRDMLTARETAENEHRGVKRRLEESEAQNKRLKTSANEYEKTKTILTGRVDHLEGRLQNAEDLENKLMQCERDANAERATKIQLQRESEHLKAQLAEQRLIQVAENHAALMEAEKVTFEETAAREKLEELIEGTKKLHAEYIQKLAKVKAKGDYLNAHWQRNKESVQIAKNIVESSAGGSLTSLSKDPEPRSAVGEQGER